MTSKPASNQPSIIPRRTMTPDGSHMRHIFNETFNHLALESYKPDEKNPQTNEYHYSLPEVRKNLAEDINRLANSDPFIKLTYLIENGDIDPENSNAYICSYKLTWPHVKNCNDHLFGQIVTNEILNQLHDLVTRHLSAMNVHVLHTSYKGGIFSIQTASESTSINGQTMADVLSKIESSAATEIFMPKVSSVLDTLKTELSNIEKSQNETKSKLENNESLESEELQTFIKDKDKRLHLIKNIANLNKLATELKIRNRCQVNFGFAKLSDYPLQPYIVLRNAECAANLAKTDTEKNHAEYSHEAFLLNIINAARKVKEKVFDSEKDDVLPEWKEYFYYNKEKKRVQMKLEMIRKYRKIEDYYRSDLFQSKSPQEQVDEKTKLNFFGEYFHAINTADVVKPYTVKNISDYLQSIRNKVDIIYESEKILNDLLQESQLRNQWAKIIPYLHESSKASALGPKSKITTLEGEPINPSPTMIIGNTRSLIANLKIPGLKLIISADHSEFAVANIEDYENTYLDILDMAKKNNVSEQDIQSKSKQYNAFIKSGPYIAKLLSFGDAGTVRLRSTEQKIYELTRGNMHFNADGGDELLAILHLASNHNLPRGNDKIANTLHDFAIANRLRLTAFSTSITFDPIESTEERMKATTVSDKTRKTIVPWIRLLEKNEEIHKALKIDAENNQLRTFVMPFN